MATIRKRTTAAGTASYHVQIRLKGAPPHTASFRRLTDARKWAQRVEADLRAGRHFPGHAATRHTVTELLERYRTTILPRKRPNSISQQRSQLRWWQEHIGHLRLADVTPAVIADHRDRLAQSYQASTVGSYLAALSHVFTTAIREWQWLDTNPISSIRKPRPPQWRIRFLTDEERARLLDACRRSANPHLYPVVVLALATGARKMELLSLRWEAVDLQRGTLTFHVTKSGTRRTATLTGHALQCLRAHATVRRLDTDLVFPRPDGQAPQAIGAAWDEARTAAGLTDFRFHDLRHTFASYLAMSGATIPELADALGHRSLDMVQRYAHIAEQHTAGVVARMTARIFGDA